MENIIKLPASKRYSFFISKAADFQKVWGLKDSNGWAICADENGQEAIPFWPEKEFADKCACNTWAGNVAKPIGLNVFMEAWIKGMIADGIMVAIFTTTEDKGVIVTPEQLKQDLETECKSME